MIAGLQQDWGKQRLHSWRAHTKWCVHRDPGEEAVTPGETETDLPASVGGSPVEGGGLAVAHHGDKDTGSRSSRSTLWREPSQSLSIPPPKSPDRLQCWVASSQTTNREGTQPHPSTVKQIKVLLSSAHQSNSQLYPPPVPPTRKLAQAS